MDGEPTRKVVLGLGNVLNRDEGLGVMALRLLEEQLGPTTTLELVDGGVLGLDLLPLVEDCSHLLVLDAADARQAPGTVIEMSRDELPVYAGLKLSQHQVTFQEVLGLASLRDRLPVHLHLIGVQPGDMTLGMGQSPAVQAALPLVTERAAAILAAWRLI